MRLLIITVVLMLAGCAEYQAVVSERGAQAADNALTAASWAHCKSATAAAIERKYQVYTNPNGPQAKAWRELCYGADEVVDGGRRRKGTPPPDGEPRSRTRAELTGVW